MPETNLLSKSEEEILTSIGYLVMRWNYAEWCARQILRMYVSGDSLNAPEHLKLSGRMAKWIEDELKSSVLPKWQEPGRPHLERLIEAYAVAREHRNHLVHGIYQTAQSGESSPAHAILLPAMPKNGKAQLPQFKTAAEIWAIATHFHDLAMFAWEVMVAFDLNGKRAVNKDGTFVVDPLSTPITPLPPCEYVTT